MKEVFLLLFSLLGERLYGLGGAGNIARANLPIRFSIPCSQSSTGLDIGPSPVSASARLR